MLQKGLAVTVLCLFATMTVAGGDEDPPPKTTTKKEEARPRQKGGTTTTVTEVRPKEAPAPEPRLQDARDPRALIERRDALAREVLRLNEALMEAELQTQNLDVEATRLERVLQDKRVQVADAAARAKETRDQFIRRRDEHRALEADIARLENLERTRQQARPGEPVSTEQKLDAIVQTLRNVEKRLTDLEGRVRKMEERR